MKMKLTPLLILLFYIPSFGQIATQSMIQDALQLSKEKPNQDGSYNLAKDSLGLLIQVLAKYDTSLANMDEANLMTVKNAYSNAKNPYIGNAGNFIDLSGINSNDLAGQKTSSGNIFSSLTSSGIDITTVTDGLAQFLVQRTKAELNLAFFNKFKKALEDQDTLQQLFPATFAALTLIDQQIFQFQSYLEMLRSAFEQDFRNMPEHLADFLNQHAALSNNIFKEDWMKVAIPALLAVTQMEFNGASPPEVLNYLANQVSFNALPALEPVEGAFKVLNLLSASLLSNSDSSIWSSPTTVIELIDNPTAFELYLGMLYQKGENIKLDSQSTLRGIIKNWDNQKVQQTRSLILSFAYNANGIQENITQLDSLAAGSPLRYEVSYNLINNFLQLFDDGFKARNILTGKKLSQTDKLVLDMMRYLNEFYLNIRLKNYSAAVLSMAQTLTLVLEKEKPEYLDDLVKYGAFMAAITKAENSSEVATAIEAFALPVGSSSTKKYSNFNMAVNAYVGGFYGTETLQTDTLSNRDNGVFGLSTPIGITASIGFGKGGSLSIFGSLIDIGALTAFRFDDDETADLPKFNFGNILAPGAYVMYGFFGDLPISIGAGWQLGPNLREVNSSTLEISQTRASRVSIIFAVDIPLINLANKPKK